MGRNLVDSRRRAFLGHRALAYGVLLRQGDSKALPRVSSLCAHTWLDCRVERGGMESQGKGLEGEHGCDSVHLGMP